ncbi:hypothetical protein GCM10027074_54270 [Streptomyces deserti]
MGRFTGGQHPAAPCRLPVRRRGTGPPQEGAQRAVGFLSDSGFPVERTAIIGSDLRMVETVLGRLTRGLAALAGAGSGAWFGLLIGLLLSFFAAGNNAIALLLSGLAYGAVFGAGESPDRVRVLLAGPLDAGLARIARRRPAPASTAPACCAKSWRGFGSCEVLSGVRSAAQTGRVGLAHLGLTASAGPHRKASPQVLAAGPRRARNMDNLPRVVLWGVTQVS